MLGADVVAAERERLAQRELEHALRARRERDLAGHDLVAHPDDLCDRPADVLGRDLERAERLRGDSVLDQQQPEQQVLGADVVVLQRPRLRLSLDDHLACPVGEALEHRPHSLRPLSGKRQEAVDEEVRFRHDAVAHP